MKKAFWTTTLCSLGYLVLATLCLVQWSSSRPWLRLDLFSGGYLLLRFGGAIHSLLSSLKAFRSRPLRTEWWALNSDPAGPQWVMLLMALDLTAFLDYGHWRMVPALVQPGLQLLGLALYIAVSTWQIWTDDYLARYFDQNQGEPAPMNYGPYRYVRHPRYAAAIVGKIAMALVLASICGWLLVIAWAVLLLRKMGIEEQHLRKSFGQSYDLYAQSTAKVIPGIY